MSNIDSNLGFDPLAPTSTMDNDQIQKVPSSSSSSDINIDEYEQVEIPKGSLQQSSNEVLAKTSDLLAEMSDSPLTATKLDDKLLDFDSFGGATTFNQQLGGIKEAKDIFDPFSDLGSNVGLGNESPNQPLSADLSPNEPMMSEPFVVSTKSDLFSMDSDFSSNDKLLGLDSDNFEKLSQLNEPTPEPKVVTSPPKEPMPSPREPTPPPKAPTPPPREPTPPPKEPTPPPREPTPPPKEPTPPPREPTPPPKEPTPPPKEPTPPPREPTPPPKAPTPPPREPTPPPKEPTPPPRTPTPPPREPTPPPREPTPPPREPTPPPREPTPPPREPTPPPPRKSTPPVVKEPPMPKKLSKGAVQESKVSSASKEVKASLAVFDPRAWFHPDQLDPRVVELIYWHDIKKTGLVFGSTVLVLLSLAYLSLISVVAYTSLAALTGTVCFRIYKNIMQAIQKSQDGHPFREYLELDTSLPSDKVHEVTDVIVCQMNSLVGELKRLFLVEDLVDSVKFGCLLWCLTYVGAWFNGLTLVILSVVALFSLPKVYEQNQGQIDQYLGLVRSQVNDIMTKVKAAIPIGNKEKSQ